jgi:hypothetical protein
MEVLFEGAVWKLNAEIVQQLMFYASVLEDVPEVNTLVNGFLLSDFISGVKAYFWGVLLTWAFVSIGLARGILLAGLVLYLLPSFFSPVLRAREVRKCSNEFRNAVILYFTARRIYVSRSRGAMYTFVVFLCAIMAAWPYCLPVLLPLLLSSLLIKTEKMVNTMAIK